MLVGSVEVGLLLLLVVIVFGPHLAERFRVPGLVGLIAGGMLLGPFVLGWLENGGIVADLGAIGILYLMFLAGLGFDLEAFRRDPSIAVVYGLLGFAIPFGLSLWTGTSLLGLGLLGAALIGAMWASNTLVAYPEVRAAGLQSNRAASTAVSAGIAFDLMSLTVLAVATAAVVIEIEGEPGVRATVENPPLPIWLAVPVLLAFTLWLLPKITRWFFVTVGRTRTQRFVFALAGMAAGASVALLGGIEGLIGAFLAGLGMNLQIPARGRLMGLLDFVGNALFVPAFMVSIGLKIDPAALFDLATIRTALVFTGIVVVGKAVAAAVTGLRFGLTPDEMGLMASLSFGQAASTLAIAQVGADLGLFDQQIVNASVLTIVATALITSYATRWFVRRIPLPAPPPASVGENVLVDVRSHGSDLHALMVFAASVAQPDKGLVVPFAVPEPGGKEAARRRVEAAATEARALGLDSDGTIRVDESFADGTVHLIEESEASLAILAWWGPRFPSDYLFGSDIDRIGEHSPVPTMAVRILRPWRRIVLVTGDLDTPWRREDAALAFAVARRLRRSRPTPVVVLTERRDLVVEDVGPLEDVEIVETPAGPRRLTEIVDVDDLVVLPAHVLHGAPVLSRRRLADALSEIDLAVLAGPHRLSVSRSPAREIQTIPDPGM